LNFDPTLGSIILVCRGGFRDLLFAIADNLGTKPALTKWLNFDPTLGSIILVCRGGFRNLLFAIADNLGTKPALTKWLNFVMITFVQNPP
jgi:hypothetical protein